MAKGFKTSSGNKGPRKGEQGKSRHPGYSGGRVRKAIGDKQSKVAYGKRIRSS